MRWHSCTEVKSDEDLMGKGGTSGVFGVPGVGWTAAVIATHGESLKRKYSRCPIISSSYLYFLYCTAVKLNYTASTRLLHRLLYISRWYLLFFSYDYLKWIFVLDTVCAILWGINNMLPNKDKWSGLEFLLQKCLTKESKDEQYFTLFVSSSISC